MPELAMILRMHPLRTHSLKAPAQNTLAKQKVARSEALVLDGRGQYVSA
jgi:hypothetical protein